jgi:hypothetical protein
VRALVSGFTAEARGSRLAMTILQACIDDSRTRTTASDRIFMLAGLVSTYDAWADLADAWKAKLDEPPGLGYFKLSQALSLKDQFSQEKGWTPELRDERLCELARIAKSHALCGISCYMPEGLYNDFVKSFARHKELKDPYFLCFYQIVDAITSARDLFPPTDGLDYIFDEQQDIGKRAVHWWDRLKAVASWRDTEHLGSTPVHRDDKCFLPLQAADLYAGLRRHRIEAGDDISNMGPTARMALEEFRGLQAWDRTWTKDDLMEITSSLVLQNVRRRERRRAKREGEG